MKIITCYYNIPSKASTEFYYENIKCFFRKLTWQPVIFFTDQKNFDYLKEFAGKNIEFIIQPFEKSPVFEDFSEDFWKEQILNDPEHYHTWQLGAIWASKSYFVRQASKLCTDEWLIWVDAGCVRTNAWNLDDFTRRNTFSEPGVYVQLLNPLPEQDFFQFNSHGPSYIAGSHILFHRSKIDLFIQSYKEVVNTYIQNKMCVIDDQYIIASMCKDSSFLKTIPHNISCPDRWFFMFYVI